MDGQRCDECGRLDSHVIIHDAVYYNNRHRFCTACVFKKFPSSFCAVCFTVFETRPPPKDRTMCLTCPSFAHISCVSKSGGDRVVKYECESCKNLNPNLYDVVRGDETNLESCLKLFVAARIASESLEKAANEAKDEAARKTVEAEVARKKVEGALEILSIVSKEKTENRQINDTTDAERRLIEDGKRGVKEVTEAREFSQQGEGAQKKQKQH